jgi:hypothetical protein
MSNKQNQSLTAYIFITPPNNYIDELAYKLRTYDINHIFLNYAHMESTSENLNKYYKTLENLLKKNPNNVILVNSHHNPEIRKTVVDIITNKNKLFNIIFISCCHSDGLEALFNMCCIKASERKIKYIESIKKSFVDVHSDELKPKRIIKQINIMDNIEHNINLISQPCIEFIPDELKLDESITKIVDYKLSCVENIPNALIICPKSVIPAWKKALVEKKINFTEISKQKKEKKQKIKTLMYIGLKLNKETKEQVINKLLDYGIDIKTYKKQFVSHITVLFVNEQTKNDVELFEGLEGRAYNVNAVGYCKDDYGLALAVELPENMYCCNKQPHITCATSGVEPVYSNELFTKQAIIQFEVPFVIPTTLTFNYIFVDDKPEAQKDFH